MGAFAEARYFGWEVLDPVQQLPVKGHSLDAARLLGSDGRATAFAGGPVLLARLSPKDYHHVHYPDGGVEAEHGRLLWTVNQYVKNKLEILFRRLSVGRIVQMHPCGKRFARGAEISLPLWRLGDSLFSARRDVGGPPPTSSRTPVEH